MIRIGLTGGIGAGKSTVSAAFNECGGIIVDGDVIAREVVEPGTEGLAALVDAFTRLAEATGEARWLAEAIATADALLDLFWDDEKGGLFTTGSDGEGLIARQKELLDNATPSAASLAAVGLQRLERAASRGVRRV